jgi:hypothetical protein
MSHRTLWTATLVLFFAVGVVAAQDKPQVQTAVGLVAKVGGIWLVVDTGGGKSLQFTISAKTTIRVPPLEAREPESIKPPSVLLRPLVSVGDQVSVKYTDVSGNLTATEVTVLQLRPESAKPQIQTAVGPVTKLGETMLVVDAGGGKSLQFITSATTTLTIPPMGGVYEEFKRRKPGLKITDRVSTDILSEGDQVSVKYTDVSGKLMAQRIDLLQLRPSRASRPQK